jgi:phage baseplate assembly protein gpV
MIKTIRQEISKALSSLTFFSVAQITKIDYKNQLAKAKILTSSMKTNWLRISSDYVGDSFGEVKPLNIGDEVLICFPDGNPASQGIIIRRLYGKDVSPDQTEDQVHFKHKSGTDFLIKKDGMIKGTIVGQGFELAITDGKLDVYVKKDITLHSDKKVIIEGTPTITLNGDSKSAVLYEDLATFLNAFVTAFNSHTQIGNMGAPTSPPIAPFAQPLTPAKSTKVKLS